MGNIELAFFSDVAPITARHILENFKRGNYDTNHFFRVDRGFVAQVAAVDGGRAAPMDPYQLEVARKTVPGEFQMDVKHTRGILSMGRHGRSRLGHLLLLHPPRRRAAFGRAIHSVREDHIRRRNLTRDGDGTHTSRGHLRHAEGTHRIVPLTSQQGGVTGAAKADAECEQKLQEAKHRADGLVTELEAIRRQRLPGR